MNVRSWLRRVPNPTKIRLDRKKEIRIGEGKNKWRDALDVIALEQPSVLEALDNDGTVIRMTELAEGKADGEEPAEKGPKLPPEFQVLQAFGALLLDAYVKGAEQHARAYELAFGENTKLVTALSQQSRHYQRELDSMLEQRLQQAAEGAGGEGFADFLNGPLAPLVSTLATKMLQEPKPASNGKANGKKA